MDSSRSFSIPGVANGICCSQPAELLKHHEIRPVSLERQILFWGLGLAALLLIIYLLGSTIMPFAAGIFQSMRKTYEEPTLKLFSGTAKRVYCLA